MAKAQPHVQAASSDPLLIAWRGSVHAMRSGSTLTGTCPVVAFVVGTRVVITSNATVFDDSCRDIWNDVRVEASGARAADGTFTATRMEVDD